MSEHINAFPGYEMRKVNIAKDGEPPRWEIQNWYRGTNVGLGGYVYAEPGIYVDVALLDARGMHPTSIRELNCFGEYTKNYNEIVDIRSAIKEKDIEKARHAMGGKIAKYLIDEKSAKQLSKALKLSQNMVYGFTSATFDNPFRDPRNVNNIVALRGALYMRTLQDEIKEKGFTPIHFKTDSVKIPEANLDIIKFVQDFGLKYGYVMEHEATFNRICLINGSTYVARFETPEKCIEKYGYAPEENQEMGGQWTATAAQFQVPYVFKTLFSKKSLTFDDMCETKSVAKGAIYLDMNEKLPKGEHNYIFIGRVGQFTPVINGIGGGELVCKRENGTYAAVQGTLGYRWMESEMIRALYPDPISIVDRDYYNKKVDEAVDAINKYGDFEWFVSDDPGIAPWDSPGPPWDEGPTAYDVR